MSKFPAFIRKTSPESIVLDDVSVEYASKLPLVKASNTPTATTVP